MSVNKGKNFWQSLREEKRWVEIYVLLSKTKLDSKRNLPLLSKATSKNSNNKNKQFLYTGMLQYPLLITCQKASDYIIEEIGMNSNLVTESKVTECNRMSLTIFYAEINVTHRLCRRNGQDYSRRLVHSMRQMPEMCPGMRKAHTLKSNDCDFLISSCECDIDFWVKLVRLILLQSMTFDSVTKLVCKSFFSLL